MAPTICSHKKQMRDSRRHHGVATAAISSATAPITAATTSSSTSASSSSYSASVDAAGATRNSSVLSYVAKGSVISPNRRRHPRLQRRYSHVPSSKVTSSTDTSSGVETEAESVEQMQLEDDRYQDERSQYLQQQQQHSSSDNNIKTVLQPTTAKNGNNRISNHKRSYEDDSVVAEAVASDSDSDSGYEFGDQDVGKKQFHMQHNTDGLLSIAIKTINLVQRNKLLQKRLAQLQLETSEFIASVLANPENRKFREQIAPKTESKVSNMLLRH